MSSIIGCLLATVFLLWNVILVGFISWQFYTTGWRLQALEKNFVGSADDGFRNLIRIQNLTSLLTGQIR